MSYTTTRDLPHAYAISNNGVHSFGDYHLVILIWDGPYHQSADAFRRQTEFWYEQIEKGTDPCNIPRSSAPDFPRYTGPDLGPIPTELDYGEMEIF